MGQIEVQIQVLAHGQGLELPAYATADSAGMDLRAALDSPLTLAPGTRSLVPTGLAMALPRGFEGQVRPRSGLAIKHGISCLNSPGTIDADYRGELKVILANFGQENFVISRGDRIAQLIIAPVTRAQMTVVNALDETARGVGGFGHSGTQ